MLGPFAVFGRRLTVLGMPNLVEVPAFSERHHRQWPRDSSLRLRSRLRWVRGIGGCLFGNLFRAVGRISS